MGPLRNRNYNYEEQLAAFMAREMHPETAHNIGQLVTQSELLSAEAAMSVILEMKLDPIRRDQELLESEGQGEFQWD